jgi:hypothetical protein
MTWVTFFCLMAVAFLSLLVGAALGVRFKFYILMPATLLALMVVVGMGFASSVDPWWIALDAAIVWCVLQLGYIAGGVIQNRAATSSLQSRLVKACLQAIRRRVPL